MAIKKVRINKRRSIGILVVLLFVLSFSITPTLLFSNFSSRFKNPTDEEQNLNLSTNYLFKGTTYPFNLDDFYDDENLYKIWTGAKFQTEAFNGTSIPGEWTGVVNNDTVTPVNNTETQYGDPSNINMIKGTTDSTDNMKVNDDSSTNFTSTHTDGYLHEMPSQWDNFTFTSGTGDTIGELETIDANYSTLISTEYIIAPNEYITSLDFTEGYLGSGSVENTWVDDGNSALLYDTVKEGGYCIVDVELLFDEELAGRDFLISLEINFVSGITMDLRINDVMWKSDDIDFDDELCENVNKISIYVNHTSTAYARVYYFKIVEVDGGTPAELDVQIDMQTNDPDCSSIEFFKYSYKTNISVTMDLDIWNWDTSVWYEIESVDNFASFDDDSFTLGSGSDYVSETNQVKIRFQATSYSNDFELQIDRFRLDYLAIPAELEFTITFPFARYNEDLLAMTIQSWQKTNISQTITFKIWNYDTGSYVQISSSSDTTFTEKEYNTTSPSDFISPSGLVKLYWVGSDITNDFELHIDYLFIQIYYKLDLVHLKSFDTNGIYRYRWEITGSIHYTQWVIFEVVDPEPNFHAISESESTTRWILQGSDISPVENFTDDISGSNWDLYGVSDRVMDISLIPTDDAYVRDDFPDSNAGSSTSLWVQNQTAEFSTFIKREFDVYLSDNITSNTILYLYQRSGDASACDIDIYRTFDFSESIITWNNKPAEDIFITTVPLGTYYGWIAFELDMEIYYYITMRTIDVGGYQIFSSTEYSNKPNFRYYFSKNYQGGGLIYMQTNTTELISLQSTAYGTNYTLSSGDYFEVDFQTNSDSQINLVLLKDGVVNKTLTLSQSGNSNFNRHTAQISIDEDVEFDQLKISSTFEDIDNVKVYDIKTKKYTITGDYKDFRVVSHQDYETYLTPDTYNLRIHDPHDGEVKVNTNITISSGYNFYIYEPVKNILCRITLFSPEGDYLQFEDYHIKINRSLNGGYNQFDLVDTLFSADEETYIYIEVYDRFDASINNFSRLASSYIDLEIEVYQLEIINLMLQKTTIDINGTHIFEIASGRWINFMLSKQYYQIGYYNPSNVYTQFIIYLDSNQVYELNMSRICNIYYTNQRMEPLSFYQFKTYINGTRIINNMFYATDGEHKGIEVKDLSNISVLNYTYVEGTEEYNQISLILTQYSLKIMSLQLVFNHINITRDPVHYPDNSYYWSEWLAPRETAEYFLFAGYYVINITNYEDGGWSEYDYTLNGDDYILIGSNNTIYNVLINLANVNATIGNQITNVEINITNQNSNINNTIVNIEINLSNINSTLGSILLDINTAITNINSSIISEIVSLGTEITNINSSITNEILSVSADLSNVNSSVISQLLTLGVNISNINGSIVNQIIDLGVDITNINTSLSNQILSIGVDISNLDTSITNQILLMVADIENVNASIINQTLVMLSDISNVNSTLLNQMMVLGVNITNINATITNQILDLSVDLTNINSSISNLLTNINISISNLENDIGTFYAFTNTSFINLNNVMNTSFINIETTIFSINQTISNLVIGVSNDIYLINGTISTMITQLETNLLLMNVSINTALFDLDTTLNLIGSNITSNYILLNNSIYLNNLNINDSRIAIINNLLLINNTMSSLISEVYSAVYLINNSIYTAVVDLGTYLSLMNNTISGNLSIVLEMNEFLTDLYRMTMFSDLLNWTNIGLNTSLITSQIDAWTFVNNYINQSIEVHLRYQDLIEKLVISADDSIEQYLPNKDVEYNLWSVADGEYVDEWEKLDPKDKSVDFGFYDEKVPDFPGFDNTTITITLIILIFIGVIGLTTYFVYKYNQRVQKLKRAYAMQHTVDKDLIKGAVRPRSSRMKRIK